MQVINLCNKKIEKFFGEVEEVKNILKGKKDPTVTPQKNEELDNNENPNGGNKQTNDGKNDKGQENIQDESISGKQTKGKKIMKLPVVEKIEKEAIQMKLTMLL